MYVYENATFNYIGYFLTKSKFDYFFFTNLRFYENFATQQCKN